MTEEGKDRDLAGKLQSLYYYGTFQGVANYYPPAPQPPSHTVVGFPQSVAPVNPQYDSHGYSNVASGVYINLLIMWFSPIYLFLKKPSLHCGFC